MERLPRTMPHRTTHRQSSNVSGTMEMKVHPEIHELAQMSQLQLLRHRHLRHLLPKICPWKATNLGSRLWTMDRSGPPPKVLRVMGRKCRRSTVLQALCSLERLLPMALTRARSTTTVGSSSNSEAANRLVVSWGMNSCALTIPA
jgi:hypothetical protein